MIDEGRVRKRIKIRPQGPTKEAPKMDPIIARLNLALTRAGMTPKDLHLVLREGGLTGVHGSYVLLRKWVEGLTIPPEYWLELAADALGCSRRWLIHGDGPAPSRAPQDGEVVQPRERQETDRPSPQGEGGEVPPNVTPDAAGEPEAGDPEYREGWPLIEEVHAANVPTVLAHLTNVDDPAEIKWIEKCELQNEGFKNEDGSLGRKTILAECAKRLVILTRGK